jgi:predicted TIM-barrel fold metal-dependent hydrolase
MIIDANVHATRSGRWFTSECDATVEALLARMDEAHVDRGVLTGLAGELPTADVLAVCERGEGRLIPVGAIDPAAYATPQDVRRAARDELRGRGLAGVKLHPRLGRYHLLDERVIAVLDEVDSWDERLAVWVCTLMHVPGLRMVPGPVETLCEVVGLYPNLTFVLAHGGGPDLLRLAQAVRPAQNALLELSYTLSALCESSVALDLQQLLSTFERRIVFGSDHPEGDMRAARRRLEELAPGEDVARLVLGENLERELRLAAEVRV